MNKMTRLELGEAEIETGLSESTARSPHAVSLPTHVFSLCILSSKQGPPLFLKPGFDSSALRWWQGLFCFVSCLCGASSVHLWSQCPSIQVTRAISRLITEWGLGCISCTAFLKQQR